MVEIVTIMTVEQEMHWPKRITWCDDYGNQQGRKKI
jgi:hypothetical protein